MPIRSLGYVRWRTPKLDEWVDFATNILGFMPSPGPESDTRYFRIDDHPYRFAVIEGAEAGIDAIGIEVGDDLELAAVCRDLEAAGQKVVPGSEADADARLVSGVAYWTDPAGSNIELFHGPTLDHELLVTPLVSGFTTGDMGMGHVVIGSPNAAEAVDAYRDVLHMHSRNTMRFRMAPDLPLVNMWFLGCNPRHHTLAFMNMEWPGTMAHFMVEAASIDDVGRAYDRCIDAGVGIAMTLGKHTNDHMISFYCIAPDDLQIEFGHGGIRIDGAEMPTTYEITKVSFWGHRPPS
jgi:3,4-dihydroxy-9,10-secoandrosta-1,3,5(10)-triene-9,17-dione 4,5-dioxygenase